MSESSAPQPIGLDLVAPELYAPMLRRLAWAAIAVGVLVGVVVALLVSLRVGAAIGCVLGVPTAASALLARRRRLWLTGTVIEARTAVRRHRLDIAAATGVEILVYPGRLSRIALRVTAGGRRQTVPLAMYTDAGGGRELHILGLRTLADALSAADSAAALSVSGLLVGQLRAEARDAALAERPLYRAVRSIRTREGIQPVRLTDADIAALATVDPGSPGAAGGPEIPE